MTDRRGEGGEEKPRRRIERKRAKKKRRRKEGKKKLTCIIYENIQATISKRQQRC